MIFCRSLVHVLICLTKLLKPLISTLENVDLGKAAKDCWKIVDLPEKLHDIFILPSFVVETNTNSSIYPKSGLFNVPSNDVSSVELINFLVIH